MLLLINNYFQIFQLIPFDCYFRVLLSYLSWNISFKLKDIMYLNVLGISNKNNFEFLIWRFVFFWQFICIRNLNISFVINDFHKFFIKIIIFLSHSFLLYLLLFLDKRNEREEKRDDFYLKFINIIYVYLI